MHKLQRKLLLGKKSHLGGGISKLKTYNKNKIAKPYGK